MGVLREVGVNDASAQGGTLGMQFRPASEEGKPTPPPRTNMESRLLHKNVDTTPEKAAYPG